ncbi:MAG: hypothetical protein HOV79_19065 [Hamadaea sp.]|nr:hypothetical protein [Hamadaea sp.]
MSEATGARVRAAVPRHEDDLAIPALGGAHAASGSARRGPAVPSDRATSDRAVSDREPPEPLQSAPAPAAGAWRESAIVGFWTWLSALGLYAVLMFAGWVPFEDLPAKAGPAPDTVSSALDAWNRWDTTWYLIIADSGYHWDSRATAFFPMFPMTVRAANAVLPGGSFGAALTVSALCLLAVLILVHRLAADFLGGQAARRAAFYLLAFPTGFYLAAAYNESMYIALSVGALYCMRRGHWWVAGGLAGLASGTRMAGVLLGAAFVYEYLRQRGFSPRRIRWDALAVLLVPSGLLGYLLYLKNSFGDPLHFMESQKNWFHDSFQAPWTTIIEVAQLIAGWTPLFGPDNFRNVANLGTALAVIALLVLAVAGPWKLGREGHFLVLFAALTIALPIVSPIQSHYPLSSLWRFALECTVAFLVLARMGRNATFDRAYTLIAVGLQGAMIITFLQNNFVA